MADQETNTGGGASIQGDANAGRDVVGRDQRITTTIYESADNIAAVKHQLARLEDNTQWRLAMLEQKIDRMNEDFQTFRNSLMAGYVRLPNNGPPNQTMLYVMIGALLILIIILVALAVYWSIRQPQSSLQSMSLPVLPSVYFTTLISSIFSW